MIKLFKVENKSLENNIYSTTETVIGTWIDGKPLYRKVIDLGQLQDGTTTPVKTVLHGLTNFKLVRLMGSATRNDFNIQYPLPFIWHTGDQIEILVTDTSITIYTTTDKTNYTAYIIMEYVKTTN